MDWTPENRRLYMKAYRNNYPHENKKEIELEAIEKKEREELNAPLRTIFDTEHGNYGEMI